MKKKKQQKCVDCLHCKVSAKSTEHNRLCYCAKGKKEARHREPFWFNKNGCKEFEGMGA